MPSTRHSAAVSTAGAVLADSPGGFLEDMQTRGCLVLESLSTSTFDGRPSLEAISGVPEPPRFWSGEVRKTDLIDSIHFLGLDAEVPAAASPSTAGSS